MAYDSGEHADHLHAMMMWGREPETHIEAIMFCYNAHRLVIFVVPPPLPWPSGTASGFIWAPDWYEEHLIIYSGNLNFIHQTVPMGAHPLISTSNWIAKLFHFAVVVDSSSPAAAELRPQSRIDR